MDAEAYDRAWRIKRRAEELFKCRYPSGSFARRLPQFRSSYPDPVGDHYRRFGGEGAEQSMTPEISSAHYRAATAFNDVVSAARIAIEALAKIAAEPGRAIEIVENSFTAIEVILRLSEVAEPAGSTRPGGDPS